MRARTNHRLKGLFVHTETMSLDCSDLTPKEVQNLRGLAGRFAELLLEAAAAKGNIVQASICRLNHALFENLSPVYRTIREHLSLVHVFWWPVIVPIFSSSKPVHTAVHKTLTNGATK
jgi:hypothetical protein